MSLKELSDNDKLEGLSDDATCWAKVDIFQGLAKFAFLSPSKAKKNLGNEGALGAFVYTYNDKANNKAYAVKAVHSITLGCDTTVENYAFCCMCSEAPQEKEKDQSDTCSGDAVTEPTLAQSYDRFAWMPASEEEKKRHIVGSFIYQHKDTPEWHRMECM